jgi:hypothetical protein
MRTPHKPNENGKARELPQYVCDLLASPPRRGEGLNNWLYRAARVLHPYRTPADIVNLLGAATAGEPVKRGEIERAVEQSKATARQPGQPTAQPHESAATWPTVNQAQRKAILESGRGLIELWELSPGQYENDEPHTEEVVELLFPRDPLLCVGRSNYRFATRTREEWRGKLAAMQLIVPSPMTARTGMTQDGKKSAHTLENTGARRFLVIEFDLEEKDKDGNDTKDAEFIRWAANRRQSISDISAALLLHLAERAPLALAVFSGGKSIHGWFYCAGQSEDRLRDFMHYAVALGADRATWTRSQFVRMPDGLRDNGKRQPIIYFDPEVIQ